MCLFEVQLDIQQQLCVAECFFFLFLEESVWCPSCSLSPGLGQLTKDTMWIEKHLRV